MSIIIVIDLITENIPLQSIQWEKLENYQL